MLLHWPPPSALVAFNGGTNIGHGPVTTLFLGLILFLVPMTPCDAILYCMLFYWPHPCALVALMVALTVAMAL